MNEKSGEYHIDGALELREWKAALKKKLKKMKEEDDTEVEE